MERFEEISADLKHYREVLFHSACKRYEFTGKNGPLIGIPGVGGGWHRPVRNYMTDHQIAGVLTYFGLMNRGVNAYIENLHAEVCRYTNPVIIGFSFGGFIAIKYAERYGWDKIQKVITVAAPFEGVHALSGAFGKTFDELLPNSQLLQAIKNANPPENKLLSLISKDRYTPQPQRINLEWPSAVLQGSVHGSLQSSWEKIAPVLEAELGL